jgi:hypothetical protein
MTDLCPCGVKRLELCHHNGCAYWAWPNWTPARNEVLEAVESFLSRPYSLTSADVIDTIARYQRAVAAWHRSLSAEDMIFIENIASGTWKPGDHVPADWGWRCLPDDLSTDDLRGAA